MDLPELSLFETAQPSADLEATAMPAPETIPVASPRPDSRESGRFGSVDLTEAIDSLVAAEQTADHVPMLLAEARTYLETGLVDEARKHLENALAEAPDDTEASELLASLSPANLHAPESESSGEPPPADVSTTQRSLIDARDTANLAALLEPNWLEPSLVVDLD